MISHAEILNAYKALLERVEKDTSLLKALLPYEQFEIPTLEGANAQWFLFRTQASDFVREILNSLNQFRNYIARLAAWCQVLPPYSDSEKFDLLLEFVYPIAFCSLDYPYQLRNRLIYCACCLCDAANHLLTNPPATRLPVDKSINFKTLQSIGSGWSNMEGLKIALVSVNGDAFKKQTGDFRHSAHHRIPPAIEMGYPLLLRRMPSAPGTRRYGFGSPRPLLLDDLVDLLLVEHRCAVEAYRALWLLIEEQGGFFEGNLTTG